MATKKNAAIALAEIQDLSSELQELAIGKEGCFYKYRPKNFAGGKIYKDIYKKYQKDGNKFVFSDDLPESGILSICQGLLSVIATVEKMGAAFKTTEAFITEQINALLSETASKNGNGYHINASPYGINTTIFDTHCYLDAITWITSTVLGIVRLDIAGIYTISDEHKKQLIDLYKYCINTINKSFIPATNTKRGFNCGWNFTSDCEEPSIYFTFAVSEILIDILNTFENVIRTADISLIQNEISATLDTDHLLETDRYKENKDRIEEALQAASANENLDTANALDGIRAFSDEEKSLIIEIWQKFRAIEAECAENADKIAQDSPEIRKEKEFFRLMNQEKAPYDEESPYRILEASCKESANNIWKITKDSLASSFFASNLASTVSEAAIEASASSDAVFNVIMIINVVINTGLDEDAEDDINYFTVNGSDDYNEAILKYDNMRDTLRLAYDNCYQFFLALQKKGKDYKINEYTLSFDETFTKLEKAAGELRRAHIRIFSLMPLLVRTKMTMVEFLIRYPQYDVQIFLEQILKYRSFDEKDDKYLWLWENYAYSTSSNYYFISSLASFYDYYEKYEHAFLPNINNNQTAKKEIMAEYHKEMIEKGFAIEKSLAEFSELEKTVEMLQGEIASLQNEILSYRNDPLRSALSGFVETIIKETVIDILATELSREAARIVTGKKESVMTRAEQYREETGAVDGNSNNGITLEDWEKAPAAETTGIEKGIGDIMLALFAERFGETVYSVKPTNDDRNKGLGRLDDFDKYRKFVGKDFRRAARYYLRGLCENNLSDFVANRGESTLSGGDHRFLEALIDEKKNNQKKDT